MSVTIFKPAVNVREALAGIKPHRASSARLEALQIADIIVANTATYSFDFSKGDMQRVTAPAAGSFTLAFANFEKNRVCKVTIEAVNWGAATVSYPAELLFENKTTPTLTSDGVDMLHIIKDSREVYTLLVLGTNLGTI